MKKIRGIVTFLLSVFVLYSISVTALAAVELPDLNRTGSVSVTVRDTKSQLPVSGGTLSIYQVASVKMDNGDYIFEYTEDFSDCSLALEEISSGELAEELSDYISENKLSGMRAETDDEGTVSFDNLDLGLYLVEQDSAAEGYTGINPFLVTVPMEEGGSLVYDVDASPKAGTVTKTVQTTPTPVPNKPVSPVLPQTGQLWWPVPLLAIAGMLFVALGWMRQKNEEN